jgi:glycerate kinase
MIRVLVAPDKFKGSLAAADVAAAVRQGIVAHAPEVDVRCMPVADGGWRWPTSPDWPGCPGARQHR